MSQVGNADNPLRVAIIGSGPAGFYAADNLLKQKEVATAVDMFDRLPTPFGLVRLGVAPDHPKIKSVAKTFERIAEHSRFRFFGNVNFGDHVSLDDLKQYYHQILFTTGAQTDKRLNIPGEDLAGSHSATEFVAWYNGHPDFQELSFDLSQEAAAVIGVGNVALDVARMLARTSEELGTTDIANPALEALRHSRVKTIYVIGRRGPAQAAFTLPELQEIAKLSHADVLAKPEEIELDHVSQAALEAHPDKATEKKLDILRGFAKAESSGSHDKQVVFRFLKSPSEIIGDNQGRVRALRLTHNELYSREDGRIGCRGTDRFEDIPVGLVFRSVGYRGVALPDLPFDEKKGVIHNENGRILAADGQTPIPGLYVAGWIKRGPTGVIGTNKPDAAETVSSMIDDFNRGDMLSPPYTSSEVATLIQRRQPDYFSYQDWQRLDKLEIGRGKDHGRPRVKFTNVQEMLEAIGRG